MYQYVYRDSLQRVIVESHLYWLVDGLQENGYKVHLANPLAIKQYEGLKHTEVKGFIGVKIVTERKQVRVKVSPGRPSLLKSVYKNKWDLPVDHQYGT
ncbi:hypothetical protein ACFL0M_15995 [Thermodesulfobacteriota bacterium]